jgi:hypothetical protein
MVTVPTLEFLRCDKTGLASFKGATIQPSLEWLDITGTALGLHRYHATMAVIAFGDRLTVVNHKRLTSAAHARAVQNRGRLYRWIVRGWILTSLRRAIVLYDPATKERREIFVADASSMIGRQIAAWRNSLQSYGARRPSAQTAPVIGKAVVEERRAIASAPPEIVTEQPGAVLESSPARALEPPPVSVPIASQSAVPSQEEAPSTPGDILQEDVHPSGVDASAVLLEKENENGGSESPEWMVQASPLSEPPSPSAAEVRQSVALSITSVASLSGLPILSDDLAPLPESDDSLFGLPDQFSDDGDDLFCLLDSSPL